MEVQNLINDIEENLRNNENIENLADRLNKTISEAVVKNIKEVWNKNKREKEKKKRAFYFSAEFLVGRVILNNLVCLGVYDQIKEYLEKEGYSISILEEIPDPGLGNGGLGRLAACFLDSAATLKIPLDGYGIRYKYGYFKQVLKDGFQKEEADDWTRAGDFWSIRVYEERVLVSFKDEEVVAVPYDMPIIGYKNENINTLRLWQAEAKTPISLEEFNNYNYLKAFEKENKAEVISAVLYPNDEKKEGKILRLKQQYFFCSASLQDIIRRYKKKHGKDFSFLKEEVAIQLNDTHPVISIAELIRILCDLENIKFCDAFEIVKNVFSYTNHTIMSEALEKWDKDLVFNLLPDVFKYILKIQEELEKEKEKLNIPSDISENIDIIKGNLIHMANLAVFSSFKTNGVSKIHTEILKNSCLKDWYYIYPSRFQNKTNGITQRRWLLLCNEELSFFITSLLKTDEWITNLDLLKNLRNFKDDAAVLEEFYRIKQKKKKQLKDYIKKMDGIEIDENSIFDIQAKRLHEYKRQLLNILSILSLYFKIKRGEIKDFVKTTFLFGAKAAPSYRRAKLIIKLINSVSSLIAKDKLCSQFLSVVFVENYNVSYAEKMVAACNVSEQISTAGTEASGTGNMKFMLNGAVTLGTYDGANIEIVEEAQKENVGVLEKTADFMNNKFYKYNGSSNKNLIATDKMSVSVATASSKTSFKEQDSSKIRKNNYIFGKTVEEIRALEGSYDATYMYNNNKDIKEVVDALDSGILGEKDLFVELKDSLLKGASWHKKDQ